MDAETVRRAVLDAFGDVLPELALLIAHDCEECWDLRDLLAGKPQLLDDATADMVRWDLPLLSDAGKQYYLPAWLVRSVASTDTDHTDALFFALDSTHRWEPPGGSTSAQRAAIRDYFALMLERIDTLGELRHEFGRALDRWS